MPDFGNRYYLTEGSLVYHCWGGRGQRTICLIQIPVCNLLRVQWTYSGFHNLKVSHVWHLAFWLELVLTPNSMTKKILWAISGTVLFMRENNLLELILFSICLWSSVCRIPAPQHITWQTDTELFRHPVFYVWLKNKQTDFINSKRILQMTWFFCALFSFADV